MRKLMLLLVLGMALTSCAQTGNQSLELTIKTDKTLYRPGEPIIIKYRLKNNGNLTLNIFNPEGFFPSVADRKVREWGFQHFVNDASGKEYIIVRSGISEAFHMLEETHFQPLAPNAEIEGEFHFADHVLGFYHSHRKGFVWCVYKKRGLYEGGDFDILSTIFKKPGKYKITSVYTIPLIHLDFHFIPVIHRNKLKIANMWKGTVHSNTVVINISPN